MYIIRVTVEFILRPKDWVWLTESFSLQHYIIVSQLFQNEHFLNSEIYSVNLGFDPPSTHGTKTPEGGQPK